MGIFDDPETNNARTFDRSKYFTPGLFLVDITRLKHNDPNHPDPRKRPRNGESFVIEARVLGAQSSDPSAPQPGETAAHIIAHLSGNDATKRELARADFQSFRNMLAGALGADPASYTPEQWQQFGAAIMADDGNALSGKLVLKLECFKANTSNFTIHRWHGRATEADLNAFGLSGA